MAFRGAAPAYDRNIDGPSRGAEFAGRTTSVFVGNLPYDCTEQRLVEVFSTVGNVSNARLVFDHATGKMKGFGFVEFFDPDTASSAVRNLNGSDLDGRQLRVDHAEPDNKTGGGPRGGGPPAGGPPSRAPPPAKTAVPPGIALPPGTSAVDSISATLATIPPAQLMEILSQMKGLVTQSPDKARELLNQQPQLAYALFQAMLMMKIVDGNILARMVANNAGGGAAPQPPAPAMPPVYQQPPMPVQQQQPMHYPPPTQPAASYPSYGQPQPPAPVQPAAAQPNMANMSAEQRAILQAALQLTPDQVSLLPPEQRQMVVDIRQQYGVR